MTIHTQVATDQLLRSFRLGALHILSFAEDFSEEEARAKPNGLKPLVWYLAHILCAHDHFVRNHIDESGCLPKDFVENYAGPCEDESKHADLPCLNELISQYKKTRLTIESFIKEKAPQNGLTQLADPKKVHPRFQNAGEALAILGFHDGYHAGEMLRLREALGKDNIADDIDLSVVNQENPEIFI